MHIWSIIYIYICNIVHNVLFNLLHGHILEFCAIPWLKKPALTLVDPQIGRESPCFSLKQGMGQSQRQREWAPVAATAAWWHRRGEGGRGLKAKKAAYWLSFSSYCVSLEAYHKLHGRKFKKPKTILHHRSQTYILYYVQAWEPDLRRVLHFLSVL